VRVIRTAVLCAVMCACAVAMAQQVPDRDYRAPLSKVEHAAGKGPVVCVDEAHANFHTLGERFWAFGQLLRDDGFQVKPNTRTFDAVSLGDCQVMVISNAQPNSGGWNNYPYPTPSAFTAAEIDAVRRWVEGGGSLLLIADHMPLAGAARDLAAAFQVEFVDGFAVRVPFSDEPDIFSKQGRTLREHVITKGRVARESVDSVRSFTGQAFQAPDAEPLLVLPAGFRQFTPRKAWDFTPDSPSVPVEGWLQAAVKPVGKGRAAFFGEAAMFSAQLAGADREPMGMNSPQAGQNFQLVLNTMHWLTRTL